MSTNVREIYSLSFKAYQEYQQGHDMTLFNQRIQGIQEKYRSSFCTNHLMALSAQVQDEHDQLRRCGNG